MQRTFIVILAFLFLATAVPVSAQQSVTKPKPSKNPAKMTIAQIEWAIFDLVNAERKKEGLPALRWNADLAVIARKHSEKMGKVGVISHYEDDLTLAERMRKFNFTSWTALGENIAQNRGYENPAKAAVEKWLVSEGHRKTIFDKRWDVTAVGVAYDAGGQVYLTQEFAKIK